MIRSCGVCRRGSYDDREGEVCVWCERHRTTLVAECGQKISVGMLRMLHDSKGLKVSVTLAHIGYVFGRPVDEVRRLGEAAGLPLRAGTVNKQSLSLARSQAVKLATLIEAGHTAPAPAAPSKRCSMPSCQRPVQTRELRIRTCDYHLGHLEAYFGEIGKPIPYELYELLAKRHRWYTQAQVAELTGKHPQVIFEWVGAGKVRVHRERSARQICSTSAWEVINQVVNVVSLKSVREACGLTPMQFENFLRCGKCRVASQARTLYGDRAFYREQVAGVVRKAKTRHAKHVAQSRVWSARLRAGEINATQLAKQMGSSVQTLRALTLTHGIPYQNRDLQRVYRLADVRNFARQVVRGKLEVPPRVKPCIVEWFRGQH